MVSKNKTIWTTSSVEDYNDLERELKQLMTNGIYASSNAFFRNDVFAYVASKKTRCGLENAKRNVVLDILYNARKFAPGTEVLLTEMIVSDKKYKDLKVQRVSSDIAKNLTLQHIKSKKVKNIFTNICDLMGTTGRIHITEEPISQTEIKLSSGCQVSICIDKKFASLVKINNINFDYIKVCIIEGAPASVSEINKLLMYCHEKKIALVLLARSYPEEVINTLAVNWNNNKLKILPFIYGNDVYNINAHADLASVSGAVPISPMKGDSLQVDLSDKFGSLLNFTNKGTYITAKPTTDASYLIQDLKNRLKLVDWSNHDKTEIITKRISDLSDKTLYVKVAKSAESWRIKNELDIALAFYNSYCNKAVIVKVDDSVIKFPHSIYKKAEELQNIYNATKQKIGGYVVYSDKKT